MDGHDHNFDTMPAAGPALTMKDFKSDQMVRWCPGCGDFAILSAVQKILPSLGVPKENVVFVSGIGCSSRFPYYMNTFGFHSIHGRAPTLATAIKCARPDLQVWVITGDGDGLSIGGNHLIHALRKNADLKILLFNNKIYGLTKGQYSPTSEFGKKTKSSPMGTIDEPLNPMAVALASEATFAARAIDTDLPFLSDILTRAGRHKGSAFIEILQNCAVFNDGSWDAVAGRPVRDEKMLRLEHGKPMIFGKARDRGVRLKDAFEPEVATFDPASPPKDLLVHDAKAKTPTLAHLLAQMHEPLPHGVFRDVTKPTLDQLMEAQIAEAKSEPADLQTLLNGPETWTVPA